jgi:hypothetical protein
MVPPASRDASWIERFVSSRRVRASYLSLVAHATAFLVLALLAATPRSRPAPPIRLAMPAATADDPVDVAIVSPAAPSEPQQSADAPTSEPVGIPLPAPLAEIQPPDLELAPPTDASPAFPRQIPVTDAAVPAGLDAGNLTASAASANVDGRTAAADPGRAFAGRHGEARGRAVADRGGSAGSEAAVERGLEWLARHQAADGSWRFDLSGCRCDGGCRQPGTVTSTTAATGIALLPFLGAGHTHAAGSHRETVTRGIYYLMSRLRPTPRGGDLSEGTMYGHGVATLALAEALGMTQDAMLVPYVRDAVRFIETSQDMHGGGWRYLPGQAGDTTVTAWQIAALKSAALAGAAVPSPTVDAASRFLDRVQVRQGEGYGYLAPQDRTCTSAIGLLCRIYTAWPRAETLDRGLARLAKPGPAADAVYQNFYLSQALLLRDHPAWRRWNVRNRDQLVARQSQLGHEAGSWTFADPDTAPGGRLGHTALAILTLEVYYRLLPIYGEDAANTGW